MRNVAFVFVQNRFVLESTDPYRLCYGLGRFNARRRSSPETKSARLPGTPKPTRCHGDSAPARGIAGLLSDVLPSRSRAISPNPPPLTGAFIVRNWFVQLLVARGTFRLFTGPQKHHLCGKSPGFVEARPTILPKRSLQGYENGDGFDHALPVNETRRLHGEKNNYVEEAACPAPPGLCPINAQILARRS